MKIVPLVLLIILSALSVAQDAPTPIKIQDELRLSYRLDRLGERDSSLHLLQRALVSVAQLNNPPLEADTRLRLVEHFVQYQLRDSLEQHLGLLIDFTKKNGLPKRQVQALLFQSGHLLETQRYAQALGVCEQATDLARPLGDSLLEGRCLLYRAMCMRVARDDSHFPVPLFYEAMEKLEGANDTANVIRAALLISAGEHEETIQQSMLQKAERLVGQYNDVTIRMSFLNFKAARLSAKEGLPLLIEALAITKRLRIPNMVQHLHLQLSYRYLALEQYDQALAQVDSARAAFPGNLPDDGALNYYDIYKAKGDFTKAIEYMEQFRQFQDERQQEDMKSLVAEWETTLHTKETEWELKNQQTRNLLLAIILALTFVVVVFAVAGFLRQRKAKRQLAQQNRTIHQQTQELQSLEKLKSRFFANVSHELRTPLTLMLGPVDSILKRKKEENEETKLLRFVQRNGLQLQKLVNEILDLSKLEDNKLTVEEEPVRFHSYLKEQLSQFQSVVESDHKELAFDFAADESLHLLLDKSKFEKIIHNFLSNALKFTPPGGKIKLAVAEAANEMTLRVSDTGPGIHPEDLPHVFDRFYQAPPRPSPKGREDSPSLGGGRGEAQGGTGIGLSLVKELAELLGGKVWAESKLGVGSVFYFRFSRKEVTSLREGPIEKQEGVISDAVPVTKVEVTPSALPKTSRKGVTSKATILIVEDNPDLREYLQFVFSDYRTITAENGKVALEILAPSQPPPKGEELPPSPLGRVGVGLIISDLMMPVMDGFQFLEKIKSDDRWRHIPTIMLTAKVNMRSKLRALRIGVDDYLTKPFSEDELQARVKSLLRNYQERMTLFNKTEKLDTETHSEKGPVIAAVDAEWLAEVENVFIRHLADNRLKVDFAAGQLHLSERQFYRRLKKLTGLTPNQYLQDLRLAQAKELLNEGALSTVKEVAAAVGFNDVRYFSNLFEKHFSTKPSDLKK